MLLVGFATTLATKAPLDVTVLRGIGAPFTEEADGRIMNQIRVKVTNRRREEDQVTLHVEELVGADLSARDITVIAPENPLIIGAGATRATSMFVLLPRRAFPGGERHVTLVLTDKHGYREVVHWQLLGPVASASAGAAK